MNSKQKTLLLTIPLSIQAADTNAAALRKLAAQLESKLEKREFVLRRLPSPAQTIFPRVRGTEYILWQKASGLFANDEDVSRVSVVKVRLKDDDEILYQVPYWRRSYPAGGIAYSNVVLTHSFLVLSLRHPSVGKGEMRIGGLSGRTVPDLDEMCEALGYVLKSDILPSPSLYIGNTSSKVVHFAGSGHCPGNDEARAFDQLGDATMTGYRSCPLCMWRWLTFPYAAQERQIGRRTEAQIRCTYRMSGDTKARERVRRIGESVLQHWPIPLKGYDYKFDVVDDRYYNAVACAGGFVFVNQGLVDSAESDGELEAALAHEIAHVEQRHAVRQYLYNLKQAESAEVSSAILGSIVAGVLASQGGPDAASIAAMSQSVLRAITMTSVCVAEHKYSRALETEADIYAALYFEKTGRTKEPLLRTCDKMKTIEAASSSYPPQTSDYDTHCPATERSHILSTLQFITPGDLTFDAFSKDDELLYSFRVGMQCVYEKRDRQKVCMVIGDLRSTEDLGEKQGVEALLLSKGTQKIKLLADLPTTLPPLGAISTSFTITRAAPLTLSEGYDISLDGITAKRVVKRVSQ